MISTLHIKNIGIIENLTIDFNEGLNILTGETGAGKSLIINALGILAGGRFSRDMIRKGANSSVVEACIYSPNNLYSIDNNIVITREVYFNGRNSCKINGRLVTVNELKEFMTQFINIHGQHDNQNLLNPLMHINYLDEYIGADLTKIKNEYRKLYKRYNELSNKLKRNYIDDREKERKLDLLNYQLKEIQDAKIKIGDDFRLQKTHEIMKNSEKLKQNLEIIDNNLRNQAIDSISESIRCLEKISGLGQQYENKLIELKNIYYEVQEISNDINYFKKEIFFDEEERENVENKLTQIYTLKRKYGNNIEEILDYKEKIKKEIEFIENVDSINEKIKKERNITKEQMIEICKNMNKLRANGAKILQEEINTELKDLELNNAKMSIKVELMKEERFNDNGLTNVEFFISTNKGEEEKELTKIISGGEMSRIMLAIKTVLADIDKVHTLVFDEIDTGISGKAANMVGEKLKQIANRHQVLVITHSATIAAKGEHNYYIGKIINKDKTYTTVKQLNETEVLEEIARISSGDVTEISLAHARELRNVS